MAEKKKTLFNSLWQQPELQDNPNWYETTISGDRLGYDEHGQVVIKEMPRRELQKEINSFYDDYCLSEQIRKAQTAIANGENFEGQNYGDVSDIPADPVDQMAAYKANAARMAKLKTELGPEATEEALKAKTDKDLEELVAKLINEKIEKAAQTADEKKEDKQ